MNRISLKLTIIFTIIIGISIALLGVIMTRFIENSFIDASDKRIQAELILLNDILAENFESDELKINAEALESIITNYGKSLDTRTTLIDLNGNVIVDSQYNKEEMENHAKRPEIQAAYKGEIGKEIRYSNTLAMDMLYVAKPFIVDNKTIGVIRLSIPLERIKLSLNRFWYSLVFLLVVLFLVTILVIYRVADKLTKPLEHMIKIANKISENVYTERLPIQKSDEIGQLGLAINKMAESLETQMATIKENEEKLLAVLNNMSSGVILVDKDGKIILANPALEWLIGESGTKLIGEYHYKVGNQDNISELINRSLTTGESIQQEVGIYYPTERYLNGNIVPIIDKKGKIYGVLAVLHDITQIKRLENMRTEFVANVSHELRTPVTAVKGFAETLLDGAIKDEETAETFLNIIYQESDRLDRLISDLLDLSKIELNKDILKYVKIDLYKLITDTLITMKNQIEKRNLTIVTDLIPTVAEIDEDRIKQVIINLLTNAIAYTPEGGAITLRLSQTKRLAKIEIEDTGIGIPNKSIDRIFERFYRVDKARSRESGGTGLGLAIAKHIIEAHEGNIGVESKEGIGTKFTIILPVEKH